MSQGSVVIADGTGSAVLAAINAANQSLVTLNSGASAPATTVAYMLWADTTTATLKMRNSANAAWIIIGPLADTGIQTGAQVTVTAAGTADAITATLAPVPGALVNGMELRIRSAYANATTTPTFSPNGLTAKTIIKGANMALTVGDIPAAGYPMLLRYDSTYDKWLLLNPYTGVAPAVGNKNKIINGAMLVDQRNAGAAQTVTAGAALAYTVDRFYAWCTGANITSQQVDGSIANTKRLQLSGATSNTGVGIGTRLEAADTAMLAGKTCTLQAKLSSNSLTTITWAVYYASTMDTFGTLASPTRTQIATGTFTISSTEAIYSTLISIPAAAYTGIEVIFTGGALVGTRTLTLGDVQLADCPARTEFDNIGYGETLQICQRYFEMVKAGGASPNGLTFPCSNITGSPPVSLYVFKVDKRVAPTTASSATAGTVRYVSNTGEYGGNAVVSPYSTSGMIISSTSTPATSHGWLDTLGNISVSAEL
jgi:hypothetical protein